MRCVRDDCDQDETRVRKAEELATEAYDISA